MSLIQDKLRRQTRQVFPPKPDRFFSQAAKTIKKSNKLKLILFFIYIYFFK